MKRHGTLRQTPGNGHSFSLFQRQCNHSVCLRLLWQGEKAKQLLALLKCGAFCQCPAHRLIQLFLFFRRHLIPFPAHFLPQLRFCSAQISHR